MKPKCLTSSPSPWGNLYVGHYRSSAGRRKGDADADFDAPVESEAEPRERLEALLDGMTRILEEVSPRT